MGFTWSSWAAEEEKKTKREIRNATRPINILVIGRPGAGKSTLVSSLRSCITHSHGKELAPAGKFPDGSFTMELRKYEALQGGNYSSNAVIYDMPGLPNHTEKYILALIQCIIEGKVPVNTNLMFNEKPTEQYIKNRFSIAVSNRQIDRIIFVHSCVEEVSENLMTPISKLCHKLGIVAFAVLTHIDEKHGKPNTRMKALDLAVGTEGSPRSFKMELYHKKRQTHSKYKDNHETNYYLYLLWQGLLNYDYPIHSTP